MTEWKPPVDETLSVIDTEISRPNTDKVVIHHEKERNPKYGDSYVHWKRTETIIRDRGNVVIHERTNTYIPHKDEWNVVFETSYSHELADDNVTVAHDGREWDKYGIERSNKCVNLRFQSFRENKPQVKDEKAVVRDLVESQL